MPEKTFLIDAIAKRWSPRSFTSQPVDPATFRALFEAARWSSSCFNEQPWRFLVATTEQPDQFARILKLLVPANQAWAGSAYALGLTFGKKTFTHNGNPDRFGLHDAGAALTSLLIQAAGSGLQAHGMGGFDADAARQEFSVPDDFEVGAAFAIGYPDGDGGPPAERSRRELSDIVFSGGWEQPAFPPAIA